MLCLSMRLQAPNRYWPDDKLTMTLKSSKAGREAMFTFNVVHFETPNSEVGANECH
jgi:hypothetical protein